MEKEMTNLKIVIVVSLVFMLAGLAYINQFSSLIGNDNPKNPFEGEIVQMSPEECGCNYKSPVLCELLVEECRR